MRNTPGALLVAVAALAFVGSVGCRKLQEKAEEKAAEKATETLIENAGAKNVDITNGGKGITLEGKDGTKVAIGTSAQLPDGWPTSTFPMYPGASLSGGMSADAPNGKGKQLIAMLETTDSGDKVVAFYKDKMKSFKSDATMSSGSGSELAYSDAKTSYVVIVTPTGQKTAATLTVAPK